jgi:hypothetical protein
MGRLAASSWRISGIAGLLLVVLSLVASAMNVQPPSYDQVGSWVIAGVTRAYRWGSGAITVNDAVPPTVSSKQEPIPSRTRRKAGVRCPTSTAGCHNSASEPCFSPLIRTGSRRTV